MSEAAPWASGAVQVHPWRREDNGAMRQLSGTSVAQSIFYV